ncbi:MAG: hypothetical protein RJA44_768 [Pseudomonadota bacterium]
MNSATSGPDAARIDPNLEAMLDSVEGELAALGDALRRYDGSAIEGHAQELQRALAFAVDGFTRAARSGGLPLALRNRLAQASSRVAAQRESLARATFALDRAIDSLLPREPSVAYKPAQWMNNGLS